MGFSSLRPLRHRSFALALGSNFISSIGGWMQSVALGVYLIERTHDPVWLGAVTMAAWMPALIGSPLGGVIAERYPRQRWIQVNNVAMALEASALAALALTHHLTPLLATLLALVEGLCGSASWAAWQSLLRDLVDRDEVLAAVSLSSAQFNLGRVFGPVAAALALSLGSYGWSFALNAASFVAVVIAFQFVRAPARPRVTTPIRVWAELGEGARSMWETPGCRNPILAVAGVGLVLSPFISLVPAMAVQVLHAGRTGTSWLVTSQGVGAVIAALVAPVLARRTSRVVVLTGAGIVSALSLGAYAASPTLAVALASLFVLGGAYVAVMTGLNTAVQLHAPEATRSRILSLYTLSLSVFYPLGALAQSALTHLLGVRGVEYGAAAALLVWWGGVKLFRPKFFHVMGPRPAAPVMGLAD
ncbi:MAG: MFS transporter [Acidobacteria bacterium]|nr:MFS transporter [Acidobacteriota bacterium]